MSSDVCDIAIVGGGAAGLAAGIFAGEAARGGGGGKRIVLLDGAKALGAKILVSGGGRCNVTHEVVGQEDFNGPRNVVRNVLAAFDEKRTIKWFYEMGVELKREPTGKLFPVTDSARMVVEALVGRVREVGVEVWTGCRVKEVERRTSNTERPTSNEEAFVVKYEGGELRARRVIVATGGRSLPKTGSDGGGYGLVKGLGHTVTETWAALVPLVLEERFFHAAVSGMAVEAELSLMVGNKRVDRRAGSLLFTHFGVSGPVVMDASRHWVGAAREGVATLVCNFFPGETVDDAERRLIKLVETRNRATVANALGTLLPGKLAEEIVRYCGIAEGMTMSQLPKGLRRQLAVGLVAMVLPVVRDRGWNYAEVTAGGVPMSEVDFRTMESRKCPGLYLAGEILDVDGRIGGFNFQWAWATGYLAGRGAAKAE